MTDRIQIGGREIGLGIRPFVIAEMSGNHNQSLDRALAIVDAAATSGAHALKLQTYTADSMTLDIKQGAFCITDPKSPWHGRSLYDLYQEAHTPWDWHPALFRRCRQHGILCFSTPFDAAAVDFLETLDAPCYKIASFENIDLPLIRRVASTGKPLLMSTGMASLAELDDAVSAARNAGCRDLVLLKCTSSYPSTPETSNIRTIPHMRQLFNCEVGLSDHTLGIGAAVSSVALGATVIEKHFTLSRAEGGVDSQFSLEPMEMRALVEETDRAWQALGKISYGIGPIEESSLCFRRTLYVIRDMRAGETLQPHNFRAIRPGFGLSPKFFGTLIGKRVNRDVTRGTPLTWDLVG